jgi:hypothetical protein
MTGHGLNQASFIKKVRYEICVEDHLRVSLIRTFETDVFGKAAELLRCESKCGKKCKLRLLERLSSHFSRLSCFMSRCLTNPSIRIARPWWILKRINCRAVTDMGAESRRRRVRRSLAISTTCLVPSDEAGEYFVGDNGSRYAQAVVQQLHC